MNLSKRAPLCDIVTDETQNISYTVARYKLTAKGDIEMNPFVKFMASTTGRIVRIVAGLALIAWGLLELAGVSGVIVAVVGAVPLLAGVLDFCIFAPLFGNPLSGPNIRAAK
jgi:hypothetical protein